jgi:cob(I)alamin adenosyltransferase
MTELHDRQSMERLHQHLARAERELQDAQHFLDPGSSTAAEMDIVRAVAAARLTVEMALERVRSQLGEPEP